MAYTIQQMREAGAGLLYKLLTLTGDERTRLIAQIVVVDLENGTKAGNITDEQGRGISYTVIRALHGEADAVHALNIYADHVIGRLREAASQPDEVIAQRLQATNEAWLTEWNGPIH